MIILDNKKNKPDKHSSDICIIPNASQYSLVAKDIIQKIHDGAYRPGCKLESVRDLAARYGVGRQVIVSAINFLSCHNYIYTEPKRGVFVNQRLDVGLYYRIGFFVNDANMGPAGNCMFEIYNEARRNNYFTVLGCNFEEDFTISTWLDHKKNLDGVIISGSVNDEILRQVERYHIPYVVLGNYSISARHPQVTVDVRSIAKKKLIKSLLKFADKCIAVLLGPKHEKAACEAANGFADAIKESGAVYEPSLIKHCDGEGYKEVARLLEHDKPDVIYVHGAQRLGLSRYYSLHPKAYRPYLIINSEHQQKPEPELCDEEIYCNFMDSEYSRKAVSMLIGIINEKLRKTVLYPHKKAK